MTWNVKRRRVNCESLWARLLRWWMPATGTHATAKESGEYPVLQPDGNWDYEDYDYDDDDWDYGTCVNGCPEGHLGRHKLSCQQAGMRETRYDLPIVRPYMRNS